MEKNTWMLAAIGILFLAALFLTYKVSSITGNTIIVVVIGTLFFAFSSKDVTSYEAVNNYDRDITIYKSGSCGCCDVYSSYFRSRGNPKTKTIDLQSLQDVKKKYEVPAAMESCHTTIIGDYFIEGHIPLEAVKKLLYFYQEYSFYS